MDVRMRTPMEFFKLLEHEADGGTAGGNLSIRMIRNHIRTNIHDHRRRLQ